MRSGLWCDWGWVFVYWNRQLMTLATGDDNDNNNDEEVTVPGDHSRGICGRGHGCRGIEMGYYTQPLQIHLVRVLSLITGRGRNHLLVHTRTEKYLVLPFHFQVLLPSWIYFFTPEMWNLLVTETNCYAAANLPDPANTPNPRCWKDVTVSDMKAFVGLILMGVLRLPRLEMYWQQSNLNIATNEISNAMTKTKFEQITLLSSSCQQWWLVRQPWK